MGEYREANGTTSFKPDDTDTEFYIVSHYSPTSLGYILELARIKWGEDIDINDLAIEPQYIQTSCLGYDLYDATDYTHYLRIEYLPQ